MLVAVLHIRYPMYMYLLSVHPTVRYNRSTDSKYRILSTVSLGTITVGGDIVPNTEIVGNRDTRGIPLVSH